MKFHLLDFQRTASEALISEIKKAQARYENDPELLGAVVLEAATGAGKTVIATSVIEQLIFGSDFTDPVEGTTVLWVTNDPNLNAQTARKMQEASEKISDIRLIGQGASFDGESFDARCNLLPQHPGGLSIRSNHETVRHPTSHDLGHHRQHCSFARESLSGGRRRGALRGY